MSRTSEPPDRHQYLCISFYREKVLFFVAAIKYYEDLLKEEERQVEADPHLSALLTKDIRRQLRIGRDHSEATRLRERLEQEIAKQPESFDIDISLSHRITRYLKSVGLLYLDFLKQKRNEFSKFPNITRNTLSAIDLQITTLEEVLHTQGIFAKASPLPLLVEHDLSNITSSQPTQDERDSSTTVSRPKPVIIKSIEILDPQLRDRCLDLFTEFEVSGQPERHDTVVSEATRVLENRLRILTRTNDNATGMYLAARAFAGQSPLLRVSETASEQEAVHLLFRGTFGFIRNSVQHRLLSDLAPERVLQILGLIDYLIFIANTASPAETKDE